MAGWKAAVPVLRSDEKPVKAVKADENMQNMVFMQALLARLYASNRHRGASQSHIHTEMVQRRRCPDEKAKYHHQGPCGGG